VQSALCGVRFLPRHVANPCAFSIARVLLDRRVLTSAGQRQWYVFKYIHALNVPPRSKCCCRVVVKYGVLMALTHARKCATAAAMQRRPVLFSAFAALFSLPAVARADEAAELEALR
jgi:hypothetical protein